MSRIPDVSDGWAEGRYMDMWMLVHFLSGAVGGFSNVFFNLSTLTVSLIGLVVMIAWEIFERVRGIREASINRAIDVAVGMAGLWLAVLVARFVEPVVEYWLFGVTWAVALVLMAMGLRAYKRRKKK